MRTVALAPLALFVAGLAGSLLFAWGLTYGWLGGNFGRRYVLAASPFFFVLLAYLVALIGSRRKWVGGALVSLVALLSLVSHASYLQSPPEYQNPDLLAELRSLASDQIRDQDHALFTSAIYAGYYQMWFGPSRSWSLVMADPFKRYLTGDVQQEAGKLLDGGSLTGRALWLFLYGGALPENEPLRTLLAERAFPAGLHWLVFTPVNVYALPQGPLEQQNAPASFEQGIDLVEAALTQESFAGGVVNLSLAWRAGQPLHSDYTVFVHLVDAGGRLWTQHDEQPVNGELPTTAWVPGRVVRDNHGLLLPTDIPPGTYEIRAGLYDPHVTPRRRLELVGGGNAVSLGPVEIRAGMPARPG